MSKVIWSCQGHCSNPDIVAFFFLLASLCEVPMGVVASTATICSIVLRGAFSEDSGAPNAARWCERDPSLLSVDAMRGQEQQENIA